jgi:hypothetical protein
MLSVEFEITNSTDSTTLHDEISQNINGKVVYDDLTRQLEKETVQLKCLEAVLDLIIIWGMWILWL